MAHSCGLPLGRLQAFSTPEPPGPPESLTVDQVRYALSQWFLARRYGQHARRLLLQDATALIAYHRRHNAEAKLSHTRSMRKTLLNSGIDID